MKFVVKQFNNKIFEASVLNEDILNGGEIYLGREEDCHIQLNSFQISRHHALIAKEEGAVFLKVLSGHGGVRVNGNEVKKIQISDEDIIEIGEFEIQLSKVPLIEADTKVEDLVIDETIIQPHGLEDDLQPNDGLYADDLLGGELDTGEEEDLLSGELESEEDLLGVDADSEGENLDKIENFEDSEEDESLGEDLVDEFSDGNSEEENNEDLNIDNFSESENENMSEENTEVSEDVNFGEGNDEFGDDFQSEDGGDGFGDDFGGDDGGFGDSGSSGESTQVFQTFAKFSLVLFGEYAPFDRYNIEQDEVFIGRDPEKCQIVLDDPEVSKVHAKIIRTKVNCKLQDLNSANGIIFNGERVNNTDLSNGDEFIIGDTTFTVTVSSDILEAENDMLMPVEENQEVEIEEIIEEEVDFDEFGEEGEGVEVDDGNNKSLIAKFKKLPPKKRLIYGVIGIVLLFMLLPDDGEDLSSTGNDGKAVQIKKDDKVKDKKAEKKLTPEQLEKIESNYALALSKFNSGEYYEAKEYLDIVKTIKPDYKDTQSLGKLIQEGLDELVRIKNKEREEKERRAREKKIKELLDAAREAVKNKEVKTAQARFNDILTIDPENLDVPPLKLEIDAYVEEQNRIKQEAERKKAIRQAKVDKLSPGKTLFLKGEWFKAVDKLEIFLKEKDMDEDLLKEATEMLKEARKNLLLIINPLVSKARSFKEGEDLKQAYETYGDVLKYDPANEEALTQRNEIFTTLQNRSRKVYREALVAESLSLFNKAKEKFQEVQQISPINSEYYQKASEKLKNYLE